jgi:predicted ABC-type ATPase
LKEYVIYAGVNGSGKSTLYNLQDEKIMNRVNPDEVLAASGKSWKDSNSTIFAMRQSVALIKGFLSHNTSFCQETTLTGKTVFRNINEAKMRGYKIIMHYVGVESVDISLQRVAERVRRGGHGIPEEDIRRRYDVSLQNLIKAVNFCDEISVYDNTVFFKPIAFFQNGKIVTRNDFGVNWFQSLFPPDDDLG